MRGSCLQLQNLTDPEMRDLTKAHGALVEHRVQGNTRTRYLALDLLRPSRSACVASLLLVREKALRMAAIAGCGTAIRMSPPRPRTSRLSFTAKTGCARPPMGSKSMALAANFESRIASRPPSATDALKALKKRSKKAAAIRVSILENGRLPT